MIICDTGPLVAALNRKDTDHARCLDLLEQHDGPLLVPSPVLAEVSYFLESRVGPEGEATFLAALADGELQLVDLTRDDLRRMVELVTTYADFPLGAVDASVMAVVERHNVRRHRHTGPTPLFRGAPPTHSGPQSVARIASSLFPGWSATLLVVANI